MSRSPAQTPPAALNPQTLNDDDLEALALSKSLEDLCLSGRSRRLAASTAEFRAAHLDRKIAQTPGSPLDAATTRSDKPPDHRPGVGFAGQLGRLERLRLDKSKITDAGLKHLEGMPEMRWLSFSGTTVSREAAERLQRDHMPACHIDDNWCNDGCLALQPLVKSPVKEPKSSE